MRKGSHGEVCIRVAKFVGFVMHIGVALQLYPLVRARDVQKTLRAGL